MSLVSVAGRTAPLLLLALAACLEPAGPPPAGADAGSPDVAADSGLADTGCDGCLPSCPATCDGADAGCGTWRRVAEIAPPTGCEATGLSLASSGASLRVSYCSCGKARLAESTGDAWTDEVVHDGCVRTALRTDPSTGQPRLLVELPGGGLRLLERTTAGAWTTETPPQISAPAAMVVDGNGHPHLVGVGQGALLHVSRSAKAWQVETAAAAPALTPGSRVHLVLGAEGRLGVAYSAGGLRVALHGGTGWQASTVAGAGLPVGLALDAQDRLHLLYLHEGLRYAVQHGGGWATEPVEPRAFGGALALTVDGCPRTAQVTDQGVTFAERTPGGWVGGVASSSAFSGLDEPLLLLPDGAVLLASGSPIQLLRR